MKKNILFGFAFFLIASTNAQTLIATSAHSDATANHNQRKIVRNSNGNIYVVFVDWVNQQNIIKGVKYDYTNGQWNSPFEIIKGYNPTLSISEENKIHLLYESNGPLNQIRHTSTDDFANWAEPIVVSDTSFKCKLPVADVDASENLNVFYKQTNEDFTESLIYARIVNDSLIEHKNVVTKTEINDIAIANHLQYVNNDIYFAIQYNQDSLEFFFTEDLLENFATMYQTIGQQPCITYNSYWGFQSNENCVRFLFIDVNSRLNQVEFIYPENIMNTAILSDGEADYICIDDIAPAIGFSYLCMQNGNLEHCFSGGTYYIWNTTMETISNSGISNPSIAYKHFSFEFVDFIWMENDGSNFNIYYLRDDKYTSLGEEEYELLDDISISGHPNPFSEKLTINISVEKENLIPQLEIYNTSSQMIRNLTAQKSSTKEFVFVWDGMSENGIKVKPGIYVLTCTAGDKRTARKVIYKP